MKKWVHPGRYIIAHPESDLGDPNSAVKNGWILVAIQPNNLRVYRKINWLEKLFRL